jgi:hypothetical protein
MLELDVIVVFISYKCEESIEFASDFNMIELQMPVKCWICK